MWWTGLIALLGSVIDKVIPDRTKAQEIKANLEKMAQDGELEKLKLDLEQNQLQASVNVEEAKSEHLFVAGWRPAIGWICALSLACFYVPQFLLGTYFWTIEIMHVGHVVAFPLSVDSLYSIVLGLLGLGGLRTLEKIKGVR